MKSPYSQQFLSEMKQKLFDQKEQTEKQLVQLQEQDPYLDGDRDKIEEPATEAMEEEGHTRINATIRESKRMLVQIQKALDKIEKGTYGTCERCGQPIDEKRLRAFPAASLCLSCETKREKHA